MCNSSIPCPTKVINKKLTKIKEKDRGSYWLSLSLGFFGGSYAYILHLNTAGSFANSHVSDAGGGLRPTISLISSTTISEGSGTSEDPYVIK